jgi:hypothetical protein
MNKNERRASDAIFMVMIVSAFFAGFYFGQRRVIGSFSESAATLTDFA